MGTQAVRWLQAVGGGVRHVPALAWLLWCGACVFAALLSSTGWVRAFDQRLHDVALSESASLPVPLRLALVDIDEQSLALLGPWPWPRPVLAQMANRLREAGARVQAWDLVLSHPTAGDAESVSAFAQLDIVVGMIPVIDANVLTPPQEGELREPRSGLNDIPCSKHPPIIGHLGVSASLPGVAAGHVTATVDSDGKLRRVPAVLCDQGRKFPQLALAAAEAAYPEASWELREGAWGQQGAVLRRGAWTFQVDKDGWLTVPYARAHRHWPVIRADQLLDASAVLPDLRGATVLLGATALGLGDTVTTAREALAPGVSVHAELVAAAMDPSAWPFMPSHPATIAAALAALLGVALLLIQARVGPRRTLAAGVALGLLPLVIAGGGRLHGVVLPAASVSIALLALCLALLAAYAVTAQREASRLRVYLRSFMPPTLADRVVTNTPLGQGLGEPRTGVILALRVTGLERWMGHESPECALGLLHAVHASTQALAASLGGRVDHAQGHTLLVTWSCATTESARCALETAQQAWEELVPVLRSNERADRPLGLELAMEAGDFWSGVVGTSESRRPVVLGAAVTDVMAMLEMHADLAAPVLIGDQATALLSASIRTPAVEPTRDPVPLVALGHFVLPGQVRPRRLHRVDLPFSLA